MGVKRALGSSFAKLWVGQTVSKFGTHITSAALSATAVLVLQATPSQMGILNALEGLPVLVFSLLAGVWVDRLRRKPILITADLGRAFILVSIPLAALAGMLNMLQLYIVAGLVGVLSVFYNVADKSFLPAIVARDQLIEANARIGSSDSLAEVAGPSLAGALVQWLSAPFAIFVDVGSYLVSAACLGWIRTAEPKPVPPARPNVWGEMLDGLRIVASHPVLRTLMGVTATQRFFGNFIGTIYWLFLVRDLHLTPAMVGISIGFGGAGAFVGTLAAGYLTRRFGIGRTMVGSQLIGALWGGLLFLPITTWPVSSVAVVFFVMQFFGDISGSIFIINITSIRQAIIPAHLLGRASASLDFVGEGASPVGALVGGVLATMIGSYWTFLVGLAGILAAALWLTFSPVRQMKDLPEQGSLEVGGLGG